MVKRFWGLVFFIAGLAIFSSAAQYGHANGLPLIEFPVKPLAPAMQLQEYEGKAFNLETYRGRVVVVNFWATWCSPCIREMPSIQKLSKLLSKESFAVLALSQDIQGWSKIRPFIQKYQLNDLPIYNDPKLSGAKKFAVKGLPTTILLDRDGRELGRLLGHAEWDSKEAIDLIKYHLSNY